MAGIVARMEADAATWACVPSTRPLNRARLTSSYGRRRDPFTGRLAWHRGLDMSAPVGTPVLASAEGRVIRAGYYGAYGYLVEMDHGNGLRTRYAHNSRLAVHAGQRVRRGEIISYVGATGRASASHLHYEVLLHGEPVNPEPYILPDYLTAE
jgi:murein DD-endopeptidase MepM/ murein hydrolase activator NlpD